MHPLRTVYLDRPQLQQEWPHHLGVERHLTDADRWDELEIIVVRLHGCRIDVLEPSMIRRVTVVERHLRLISVRTQEAPHHPARAHLIQIGPEGHSVEAPRSII